MPYQNGARLCLCCGEIVARCLRGIKCSSHSIPDPFSLPAGGNPDCCNIQGTLH